MNRSQPISIILADKRGRAAFQAILPCDASAVAAKAATGAIPWREALYTTVASGEIPEEMPDEVASLKVSLPDGSPATAWIIPASIGDIDGIILVAPETQVNMDIQRLCLLGMLSAGAAHETNNLLMVVSGWLEMAMADEMDETRRAWLGKAVEAVGHLRELTGGVLNFAGSKSRMTPAGCDVGRIIDAIEGLAGYQIKKDGLNFRKERPEDGLELDCGEAEISQAVLNLVMNARQATPPGGSITVSARCRGAMAEISVSDTGCGMSPEVRERIFEPFYTTRSDGAGLGLALCREIVERYGGNISVESEPGSGTTVTLVLPLKRKVSRIDQA